MSNWVSVYGTHNLNKLLILVVLGWGINSTPE